MPALWHACPKSAACWSPAIPAIGIAASRRLASVSATTPLDGRTSGSTALGTRKSASSSSSHAPRAISKSSVREACAGAGNAIEQPGELGRGEVRIEHEPGLRRDAGFVPRRLEARALVRGSPVLPHDRVRDRDAGLAVPEHRRLALVGDADRGDLARRDPRVGDCLARDVALRAPDLLGVVLHPAGLREDLAELALRHAARGARLVEDDRARARRALIEGEDEGHGGDYEPLAGMAAALARRPRFLR